MVLIGTGQTTVDLAVMLDKRGHKGAIMPQPGFEAYPSFYEEIKGSRRILEIGARFAGK